MSDQSKPTRHLAKPYAHESEGRRKTLSFRCRRGLYGQLLDRAKKDELSISEVIEQRLMRSFSIAELYGDQETQNLAVMVCHAARSALAQTGKSWHEDDRTRRGLSRALRVFAALIEPRGDREPGALTDEQEAIAFSDSSVIAEAAWTISHPLTGSDPRSAELAEAAYKKMADAIEGYD